jgi:hypothetical protein
MVMERGHLVLESVVSMYSDCIVVVDDQRRRRPAEPGLSESLVRRTRRGGGSPSAVDADSCPLVQTRRVGESMGDVVAAQEEGKTQHFSSFDLRES